MTKVHKTVVEENYDRKSVLTLAMMWFFKKRDISVSRGFEGLVVEDGEDEVKRYVACARLKYIDYISHKALFSTFSLTLRHLSLFVTPSIMKTSPIILNA